MSPAAVPSAEAPELASAEFARFCDLLYRQAGIRLTEAKLSLVQNRLNRRLQALGLRSYRAYYELVVAPGSAELQHCVESLTTNETFFFRHKEHWDFLITRILADWPAGRPLRLWSAAASTGEEAYSAAIACLQHLGPHAAASILATDINERVLAAARRGVYSDYAVQKITDYGRAQWFDRSPQGWVVGEAPRRLVSFARHNLLDDADGGPHDVVFLRNVLIYFDEASKRTALRQVAAAMAPGAWLFLGGSETLPQGETGFRCVRPQIFRKAG